MHESLTGKVVVVTTPPRAATAGSSSQPEGNQTQLSQPEDG